MAVYRSRSLHIDLLVIYLIGPNQNERSFSLSLAALEAPRYRHNPTNQTVNVSESLQMECDVVGTPSPQLSWSKDNQPLQHISGLLIMSVLQHS